MKLFLLLVSFSFSAAQLTAGAIQVDLGTASSFAVLSGSTVTNTGSSVVTGNVGVWPSAAITGFPPGIITKGTSNAGDAVAQQAQTDLLTAYLFAASEPCGTVLSGQDLGGKTLIAGVYCFGAAAQLTGSLTFDGQGSSNPVFVIQTGSTLITASNSSIIFENGASASNLFWQVGSSATLGDHTAFAGDLLALTSITVNTGSTIGCGSVLARNGAVTLDSNTISACSSTVPEPSTASLFSLVLLGAGLTIVAGGKRCHAAI